MRTRALVLLVSVLGHATCFADGPVFEAVSVKVSDSDVRQPSYSGGPGTSDRGRIREHIYMTALLQGAFGLQVDQIKGPAWLRDFSGMPFYDIVATMPPDTTLEQCETMLQNLLVERFHMVFHHETQNFPGYDLVVDKGGPKLKEATPAANPVNDAPAATSAGLGSDGFPTAPGTRAMGFSSTAHQRRKFQEYTMAGFAASLDLLIGRAQSKSLEPNGSAQPRVADKTGLAEKKYTFILEYNCPACAPLSATTQIGSASVESEPGGFPDIFGALQKQLGLRLDKATDVPTDVIVIESLDKMPTEN
jgi:uncharacterized protein (TIGR03435 family)